MLGDAHVGPVDADAIQERTCPDFGLGPAARRFASARPRLAFDVLVIAFDASAAIFGAVSTLSCALRMARSLFTTSRGGLSSRTLLNAAWRTEPVSGPPAEFRLDHRSGLDPVHVAPAGFLAGNLIERRLVGSPMDAAASTESRATVWVWPGADTAGIDRNGPDVIARDQGTDRPPGQTSAAEPPTTNSWAFDLVLTNVSDRPVR